MTDIEWACIAPNKVVVATANRTWLHQLDPNKSDDPFAQQMVGKGSTDTTRKLLDGAMAAAKMAISSSTKPPALTPSRWVWRLASSYHTAVTTSPLMEEASQRFAIAGRWSLAQWAANKAREERGHDQLALLDIQSMGYKAEEVVKALVPPPAMVCVDHYIGCVRGSDPIDCVGNSYARERPSLRLGEEYIQKVEALLPLGINATRYLRVHSSVGSDAEHVEEIVEVVAGLSAEERSRVAQACYETALLSFCPPREGYIPEETLQELLRPLKL
jgi:hypothetical protein